MTSTLLGALALAAGALAVPGTASSTVTVTATASATVTPAAAASSSAAATIDSRCCAIVELRQYITYPGRRDDLIGLFEREFVESQEAVGIRLLGQFRDLNDPQRFTWMRGFTSMDSRRQALTDFYTGPVWQRWKADANGTLYDNDDVLLLRPATPQPVFAPPAPARAAAGAGAGAAAPQPGLVVATIYYFSQPASSAFVDGFNGTLAPLFEKHGAAILGCFVSEHSPNTFPRLPVRENVNVFVWLGHFADRAAYDRYNAQLGQDRQWREQLFAPLYKSLLRPPETLLLQATARSLLR